MTILHHTTQSQQTITLSTSTMATLNTIVTSLFPIKRRANKLTKKSSSLRKNHTHQILISTKPIILLSTEPSKVARSNSISSLVTLVILGGAKAGTTSFAHTMQEFSDVVSDQYEVHYWGRCDAAGWKQQDWKTMIDAYNNTNINQQDQLSNILSDTATKFVESRKSDVKGGAGTLKKVCDVDFYGTTRLRKNKQLFQLNCVHPDKYKNNDKKHDNKQQLKCMFMDKSPSYVESPIISLIFAKYFSSIKNIILVRNPVVQMWSFLFNFESSIMQMKKKQNLETYVLDFIDANKSLPAKGFQVLRKQCSSFVDLASFDENNINNIDIDDDSFLEYSKQFFVDYLYQSKVVKSLQTYPGPNRMKGAILNPMIFPTLMFYIHVYDTTFGLNNWDTVKIIQSEWMFENINQAIMLVRCWIQKRSDINSQNVDKANCQKYDLMTIDLIGTNQFNKIQSKILSHASKKENSKTKRAIGDQYIDSFEQFFEPCNQALYAMLKYRPELLIGDWVPWNSTK